MYVQKSTPYVREFLDEFFMKDTLPCNQHPDRENITRTPKIPTDPLAVSSNTVLLQRELLSWLLTLSRVSFAFLKLYKNRITEDRLFGIWLLALSVMSMRFIHFVCSGHTLLFHCCIVFHARICVCVVLLLSALPLSALTFYCPTVLLQWVFDRLGYLHLCF